MKKSAQIFLILILTILMLCTLVACTESTGQSVTPGTNTNVDINTPANAQYLSFVSGKDSSSSIFGKLYVDEFKLSDIKYYINYESKQGGIILYGKSEPQPLTMNMIDENCKPLLETAGDHMIKATIMVGNKRVKGSFDLHLKERFVDNSVDVTFNLKGGTAYFGTTADDIATIKVEKGSIFMWSEFISNFRVHKAGEALLSWTNGATVYTAKSAEKIKIDSATSFTAAWTTEKITARFNLNLPADATVADGKTQITPDACEAPRSIGIIARPKVSTFNVLNGYEFVGWSESSTSATNMWNFNSTVGATDMTLFAHWKIRTYSISIYLRGGQFIENLIPAVGGIDIGSEVDFAIETGHPFKVVFTGLTYGSDMSSYTSEVAVLKTTTDGKTVLKKVRIKLSDIADALVKGSYYTVSGFYEDSFGTEGKEVSLSGKVEKDQIVYAKWVTNLEPEQMNDYYVNYLFLDNYTVKPDGTIRIDKLADTSVNEVAIPASLKIGSVVMEISEIADSAFLNSQSLVKLDLSKAVNLVSIGNNAFAYSIALSEVIFPAAAENKITNIGYQAFLATEWQNQYNEKNGNDYIVVGDILLRYVGDQTVSEIDMPETFTNTNGIADVVVKGIASGCFQELKNLENVNINKTIESINNKAFEKSNKLAALTGGGGLTFVAEDAFVGTIIIEPNDSTKQIIIGNIFYRYVGDSTDTETTIPENVTIIAPHAFVNSKNMTTITFEDENNITKIGANAFSNTRWVREFGAENNGFVVVNGLLTNYTGKAETVTIPISVKTIVEGAFGGFSSHDVKHIVVPSSVKKIEARAFTHAQMLASISFKAANIGDALVDITIDSFNDTKGSFLSRLKLFFNQDIITELEKDSTTQPGWVSLYTASPSRFVALTITSSAINPKVVDTKYLRTSDNFKIEEYWKSLGKIQGIGDKKYLTNGKIVIRSDGSTSVEDLDMSFFKKDIVSTAGELQSMVFNDGTNDSIPFVYNVYEAIKGVKEYNVDDPTTIIDGNKPDSPIVVEGLAGPHYTTYSSLDLSNAKLKFAFHDAASGKFESWVITADMVVGYRYNVGNHTITITFKYHDMAVYKITWKYTIEEPKEFSIAQISSMSIPLGSVARGYLDNAFILLTNNDGNFSQVALSSPRISVLEIDGVDTKLFETNTIGYHSAKIQYKGVHGNVTCLFAYSVVMEADVNMFDFAYDDKAKTATVTGMLNKTHNPTVVIPSVVSREVEKKIVTYNVTAIGDNAFENDLNLVTIIIPDSVTKIGNNAFSGCAKLENIQSFALQDLTETKMTKENFELVYETVINSATLTIKKLINMKGQTSIVVPNSFVIGAPITTQIDRDNNSSYSSTSTFIGNVVLDAEAFVGYTGIIHLEDNDANRKYAKENLEGKDVEYNVKFYEKGKLTISNLKFFDFGDSYTKPVFDNTTTERSYILINGEGIVPDENGVVVIPEALSMFTNKDRPGIHKFVGFADGVFDDIADSCTKLFLPNTLSKVGTIKKSNMEVHAFKNYTTISVYDPDAKKIITKEVLATTTISPVSKFSSTIESIGKSAFFGCISLKSIDFSNAVALKQIDAFAFSESGLENIDLSKTAITEIEAGTFRKCGRETDKVVDGVTSTTYAGLKEVKLPKTVTKIGNGAFSYCFALDTLTVVDENGVDYGFDAFTYIGEFSFYACSNFVPMNAKNAVVMPTAFDGCKMA